MANAPSASIGVSLSSSRRETWAKLRSFIDGGRVARGTACGSFAISSFAAPLAAVSPDDADSDFGSSGSIVSYTRARPWDSGGGKKLRQDITINSLTRKQGRASQ